MELERRTRVQRAVESLSGRCRQLLQGLYYEDPPLLYKDVARRLGIAMGSIGPIRLRCIEKLRKLLAET